ncbi:MAG: hypothetical protein ACYYNF_03855, partial [Actinomycetes bacterium]
EWWSWPVTIITGMLAGIALLIWVLRTRLKGEVSCAIPASVSLVSQRQHRNLRFHQTAQE